MVQPQRGKTYSRGACQPTVDTFRVIYWQHHQAPRHLAQQMHSVEGGVHTLPARSLRSQSSGELGQSGRACYVVQFAQHTL